MKKRQIPPTCNINLYCQLLSCTAEFLELPLGYFESHQNKLASDARKMMNFSVVHKKQAAEIEDSLQKKAEKQVLNDENEDKFERPTRVLASSSLHTFIVLSIYLTRKTKKTSEKWKIF